VTTAEASLERFASLPEDREALAALSTLVWMLPRHRLELARRSGRATAMRAAILAGRAGTDGDRRALRDADAGMILAAAGAVGARFVPLGDAGYPSQLAEIEDAPLWLFAVGPSPPDLTRCVAIVGARSCSDAGRDVAGELGRGLAAAGFTVVSGAARGIDAAAHVGALDAGGRTLAVLGAGIDHRSPNRELLERIAARGAIVSEFPPGTPPHPRHFPARNRIVAGLSRATVVVEGGSGSGALITAEHASDLGRDVFAVPGAITNPLSAGPLALIRDGAGAIGGLEDLLHDLGVETAATSGEPLDLRDDERRVLAELRGATLPERIATALAMTAGETLGILMRLELRGLVRSVGGRYERTLRAAAASPEPGRRRRG
jgi:DNA processing protein